MSTVMLPQIFGSQERGTEKAAPCFPMVISLKVPTNMINDPDLGVTGGRMEEFTTVNSTWIKDTG